ncbi:MAG: heme-binding protein [Henriciella sp.]|nr:heme-binding protein [Henriciella sp.]
MRFALLIVTILSVLPMTAGATEEPPHQTLLKDGKYEIRQYEPIIVAEVEITGDMRRAGNSGFRPLADFIFGNNTARSKIEMTAPVTRVKSQKNLYDRPGDAHAPRRYLDCSFRHAERVDDRYATRSKQLGRQNP